MISNFDFIKNKDAKLFRILNDSERLYRDGYFEQCAIQLRKFGEYVCKNTLGVRRTTEESFDEILATLKDIMVKTPDEREFIEDMYFIKKIGNLAAHGSAAEIDSMQTLDALKRAFEATIQYALKNKLANRRVLNLHFSVEVLMTGKKPKNDEKYQEVKKEAKETPEVQKALSKGVKEIADFALNKKDELNKNDVVISFEEKRSKKAAKTKLDEFFNKNKKQKKEPAGKSAFKCEENKTKGIKPLKQEKKSKSKKEAKDAEQSKEGEGNFLAVLVTGVVLALFCAVLMFILP